MSKEVEFIFKINAYTPATIPMARLAEYMKEYALLLGETSSVHFKELEEGSTVIKTIIETEAEPKVSQRLSLVKNNEGPKEALNAFHAINKKLKEDGGDAILFDQDTAEIITFPGTNLIENPTFGPITQHGSIDGIVIRLGGKKDTVPVTLQTIDGNEVNCKTKRSLAKDLANYIFGDEIRCTGTGKWIRNEDEQWIMESFTITGYDLLDNTPLLDTIKELHAIQGSNWPNSPWETLKNLREDD